MAYDQELAHRVRTALLGIPEEFTEKKMFGGLSFLYRVKMTLGIVKNELAVRVVAEKMSGVLEEKHVRPMDFTKRPMKEFVYVSKAGFATEAQLHHWVQLGLEHAKSKL
ncbi:MAG: TfoX/Sxy family protein [Bacteroidota bacterium]